METEFALSLGTQRWPLPAAAEEITLGRAANADVRLPADDQISRIHARITRTGDTWTLHDASRNGTGLNGRRLPAPTALTNNDQIHIGRSVLTFHATPAGAAAPTAPPDARGTQPAEPSTPAGPPSAQPTPPSPSAPPGLAAPDSPDTTPAPATSPRPDSPAPTSGEGDGQSGWDEAARESEWNDGRDGRTGLSDDSGQLSPASTPPPPPAPARQLTPRPAPTNPQPPKPAPADSPIPPTEAGDDARRNEPYPADRASISQPNPADASNSASWPGYPSADYLDSARSPLSGGERAQIIQPDLPHPPHPAWPDRPDRPEEPAPSRPASRPANRPERRTREVADVEVGQVRLARVLAIAAAMLAVGLVVNLIATFLADGPGGMLRWLIAPTLALLGAMTFAVLDAVSPTERSPSRLDVSIIIAIVAVLLGVGVGGFAITAGAEYAAGYLSGNETGEDRLIKPVGKTTAGLTITVDNVTNTSHFTRIRLTITNKGADAVTLPLDGNATFTSAEGNSIRADSSRSNWPDTFASGQAAKGTIVFKGHLPKGQKAATLTLRPGDPSIVLGGIPLSN